MSDPITWYALGRAVDDTETILQAVDDKILTHNLDASAHGQTNEAVYEHRVNQILDHLEGSVQLQFLPLDHYIFFTAFENLTSWSQLGTITAGTFNGIVQADATPLDPDGYIQLFSNLFDIGFDATKSPLFQTTVKFAATTYQTAHITIGPGPLDLGLDSFGFKVVNANLYAYWVSSGTEYTQQITGYTVTNSLTLRAIFRSSSSAIDFYVNGVLEYTLTTTLPSVDSGGYAMTFLIHRDSGTARVMYLGDLFYSRER